MRDENFDDLYNQLAREHFGIDYLFPFQRLVINNVLLASGYFGKEYIEEANKREIVLLPTGAGKSLCFMLPGAVSELPVLIVFPLLSLMKDQQRRIEERGFTSAVLRGGLSKKEKIEMIDSVRKGNTKFLIANPEILSSEDVIKELENIEFSHFVIDEAHTVSEWGDTFRSSYLNIGKIISRINCSCISAFTATASPDILKRISEIIFENESYNLIFSDPDRINISYFVYDCFNKRRVLLELLKEVEFPLIIFCRSRTRVAEVACFLRKTLKRDDIFFYHAGLSKEEKNRVEDWFFDSNSGVLVSTCAYGMGVDKSNIRTVIHYDIPSTVESYLQESGRGGRDREQAKAILLFSEEDRDYINAIENQVLKERAKKLIEYVKITSCRREFLISLLDKSNDFCGGCDICLGKVYKANKYEKKFKKFIDNDNNAIDILNGEYYEGCFTNSFFISPFFNTFKNYRANELLIKAEKKPTIKKKIDIFLLNIIKHFIKGLKNNEE